MATSVKNNINQYNLANIEKIRLDPSWKCRPQIFFWMWHWPLPGDSLLFITKSLEIPATHLIDLRRMKDWVDLGVTQGVLTQDPWIENPAP